MFRSIRTLTLTLALLAAPLAHATLKDSMQAIGGEFRQIFTKSKDPSLNVQTLDHARALKAAFAAAKTQYPATLEQLPPAQQEAARARFEELIQTGVVLADELIGAIEGGRQNDVAAILNRMNDLRRTGHGEFQQQ